MRGRRRRILAGRGSLSRTERAAQARRERALAHLERLRGRADAPRAPRLTAAGVETLTSSSADSSTDPGASPRSAR